MRKNTRMYVLFTLIFALVLSACNTKDDAPTVSSDVVVQVDVQAASAAQFAKLCVEQYPVYGTEDEVNGSLDAANDRIVCNFNGEFPVTVYIPVSALEELILAAAEATGLGMDGVDVALPEGVHIISADVGDCTPEDVGLVCDITVVITSVDGLNIPVLCREYGSTGEDDAEYHQPAQVYNGETSSDYDTVVCRWLFADEGIGGIGFVPDPIATPVVLAEGDLDWEVNDIDLLGEFIPHSTTISVVETIYPDATWASPEFSPPWPAHQPNPDRQDCPMIQGVKVWCTIEVRPGDVVIGNADAVSTPLGSYLAPNGFWLTNQTDHQIQVSFLYGELVVIEPANGQDSVDANGMAQVMLRLVVSTNGLSSAAYLGQIPIH